jgi:hypothetical protein
MRRTRPTPTEVLRVQRILERQPAFRAQLARKILLEKRTGETVRMGEGSITVAQRLLDCANNPERAHVTDVLRVAIEVLGTGGPRSSDRFGERPTLPPAPSTAQE